ncbi:MAG: hypothetical protein P8M03_06330 [Flavobacteriaceae bacterium]|nr:hypothetical protein [Flavobacteriaceae bacterium]
MKKLLKKILMFILLIISGSEIIIRSFNLTNDIPHRKIDKIGLQNYIVGQKGVFNKNKWKVNENGFLGLDDTDFKNQLLIIGDSMIENIMNPLECNQGYLLKKNLGETFGVFEIGRSGITLIEALEFKKKYEAIVNPYKTIIFINQNDIEESISNISRLPDRLQINVISGKHEKVIIRYPMLKKILYNIKTLYYLYLKGFFVINKLEVDVITKNNVNYRYIDDFFSILNSNYNFNNILFVINSNDDKLIFYLNKLKTDNIILLDPQNKWFIENDGHWNCYGHKLVSGKIVDYLLK